MPKSLKQLRREAREKDMRELVNTYGADAETDDDDEVDRWNFNMMRLPGKGVKQGRHDDEIPDKLKGKSVFVSHEDHARFALRDDVLKHLSQKGRGLIYDDDETEIGMFFEEEGRRIYDFDYALDKIRDFDIEKSERQSYKKRGGKKGMAARDKKEGEERDKEIKELKEKLQLALKDDPNLPLWGTSGSGWWDEYVDDPPLPKPTPEQAEAIKKLRDIPSLTDTSTDLEGEVKKLMSVYGIR